MNKEESMILHGDLTRVMFETAWPAIIAMLLFGLNALFDGMFVGRFVGESALAGVTLATPVTQFIQGLGTLIGIGAGSYLSIVIGKKDHEQRKKIFPHVNAMLVLFGVVFGLLGYLFSKEILVIMGGSLEPLEHGIVYTQITFIGLFFAIGGVAYNMMIRAEGKMKLAALIMGCGLVVNIIFNYILICIFDYGVAGAAWGTNIGMMVYYVLGLFYFHKHDKEAFKLNAFIKFDRVVNQNVTSMGMPSFISNVMQVVQGTVILFVLSKVGTPFDVAFYGTLLRVFLLLLTPIHGLMRALQPVIGINYGAHAYDRVKESFKLFTFAAMALTLPLVLMFVIKPEVVLQFMMPSSTFSAQDFVNFRFNMLSLPLLPIIYMAMTLFPAMNQGRKASLIGIMQQFVLYVPYMLVIPFTYGVRSIYVGIFLIDMITVIISMVLVVKEFKSLSAPTQFAS